MTLQNFLQNKESDVQYSAGNFAKSSFSDVPKFRNAGLPIVATESNGLNIFSRIRGLVEQGLGRLVFPNKNSSHFINKADFEQYLFNTELQYVGG